MMKCIIVDDEPLALDLIEDYVRNVPFLQLVKRCSSALEAIEVLQQQDIDLVFSDIQMQGLSGMQMIRTLTVRPMFIMITAYSNYAVEGYELDVVDYLLKPVPFERFITACNKALLRHNNQHKTPAEIDHVFFNVDYSLIKVILSEIMYIEGVGDYIKIHFTNTTKRPMLVRHSMKGIEELFPSSRFMRIHKSYIVNLDSITAIRKNSIFLQALELPVGEQYRDAVAQLHNRKV